MMAKKGGLSTGATVGIVAIIAVLVVVVVLVMNQPAAVTDLPPRPGDPVAPSAFAAFCSQNPSVDLLISLEDENTLGANYRAATVYAMEWDESLQQTIAGTFQSLGATSTSENGSTFSNAFTCGTAYKIFSKAVQNGVNSIAPGTAGQLITAAETSSSDPVKRLDMPITVNGIIQARVYDNNARGYLFATGKNSSSSFFDINGGLSYYDTSKNTTETTYTAGDFIDVSIELKNNDTNEQAGYETWIGVNYKDESNTNDWDVNTIILTWDGANIVGNRVTLDEDDSDALSAYERIYKLGKPVDDVSRKLVFKITSGQDIDPDFNPTLIILAIGDYKDEEFTGKLRAGRAYRNDASNTALGFSSVQTVTIMAS